MALRILFLISFFPVVALAQMVVTPIADVPVFKQDHSEIRNPWTGGINAAQISMFDAEYVGDKKDIFLFDKAGNRILIFTGSTENGERIYTYRPELTSKFPNLKAWALLRDFDCDGYQDIFTYSPAGGSFAVYKNTGNQQTGLQFEPEIESILSQYEFTNNQFSTNIYVSSQDIPAVFDFDGDGDLDILTFNVNGTMLELHLNYTMEETGNCGLQNFKLKNRCYGRFIEGFESNQIIQDPEVVNAVCNFNVVNPQLNDSVLKKIDTPQYRHAGTTILTFDGNQDGVPDIVLGDVGYNNLTYLENNHRPAPLVDSIGDVYFNFPANFGAPEVNLTDFAASFYEDIDGDGIRDLIVGVNNPYASANINSIWFYKNIGQDDLPQFELVQKDFLQDQTIDHGEGSAPAFFDYNGDGLLDMVIGSRGEFIDYGVFKPTLSLYLNTGTPTQPEFTLIDDDWLNISMLNLGNYITPTFGDVNGDGHDDLIIGCSTGYVYLFTNTASGEIANFTLTGKIYADDNPINPGLNSAPQLFDLNNDGKLDLIVGSRNGKLSYYQNIGSSTNPEFTLITDFLGGVSSLEPNFFVGNSSPFFYKFNNETFLAVGGESGKIHLYNQIDGNLDGNFNLLDLNAFSVKAGMLSRPAIYDINNDGIPDVFCGGIGGGIQLFLGNNLIGLPGAVKNLPIQLFPNPTQSTLNVKWNNYPSHFHYRVVSLSGNVIMSNTTTKPEIDVSRLVNGMYILEISDGSTIHHLKFIKNQ